MAQRELLAKFGFEVDTSALQKGTELLETFGGAIKGFAAYKAIEGLWAFTEGLITVGSELDDTSQKLGISTDELQAWRFAAGQSGATAEEVTKGLQFLGKNLADAAAGSGDAAKTFAGLGITTSDASGKVREASDVLSEVADAVAKAGSNSEKTDIALKLLGRGALGILPMLKGGSKGVKELQARFAELGGGLSKDFVAKADEAGDALAEMQVGILGIKSRIGEQLLPVVTWFIRKFSDAAGAIAAFTKNTAVVQTAIGIMSAAVLGFLTRYIILNAAAVASTLLWVAGFAILFLIIEDLYVLFAGGNSAIGAFIDGFFGVGSAKILVDGLKDAFRELLTWVDKLSPAVTFVWDVFKDFLKDAFGGFKKLATIGDDVMGMLKSIGLVIDKVAPFGPNMAEEQRKLNTDIANTRAAGLQGLSPKQIAKQKEIDAYNLAQTSNEQLLTALFDSTPTVSGPGTIGPPLPPYQPKTAPVTNTTINVNGAGDPSAVAAKVVALTPAYQKDLGAVTTR